MTNHAAFSIPAGELHTAAEWVAHTIPPAPPCPVLHGVLVEVGADRLTLSGFDFDLRATATIPATVTTPGRALVPGRLLAAVTKTAARRDLLSVEATGPAARLSAGRARWSLPTLPIEDYPTLPDPGSPVGMVNAGELRRALRRVLPATGRDATLPELTAVKIDAEGGRLSLAATDRFRLAAATLDWQPAQPDQPLDTLVPAELLQLAARAGEDDSDTLKVSVGEQGHLFGLAAAEHLTVGRVLDRGFPSWRRVLPTPEGRHATLATAELIRAITQVSPVALKDCPILTLATSPDTLTVSVSGDDRSAEATLPIRSAGEPISINVNGGYLREALGCVDSDEVTTHFGATSRRPILLHGDDPDRYQHLLMPVADQFAQRATR